MLAQLRIALGVCACFYVAFALSDVAVLGYTDKTLQLFLARVLVAFTAATGIVALAKYPESITVPRVVATAVEGFARRDPVVVPARTLLAQLP